ncbi:sugar porter family MFS transporter [Bifidobacterium stellenboschense]|uniref:Sugar transporter n=1 Tax=Bifidobacterium stellenboschense TaxID=762211 RepID=A0A087DAN1_9BIFI|nr:sugar porter family MFS transporter [Bifidobacterium stellenboschense]KFI92581.1 sugar transporter [Bifidobacterium stellenboschense]
MAGLFHAVSKQRNPLGTAVRLHGSGRYTFGLALSAGLAGLLYGYDTVSISGAIEFLRTRYRLDTVMEGLVISSIMLGAVIGAAWAGFLSDRFGRRRVLIAGGCFFCVSAVWSAFTFGPYDLIAARVVGGFGIGLTAALAVTYITESAPTNIRGTLTFSYQMFAVCGIFLTNVINYIIASYGTPAWDLTTGWRWMLGLGAIPALAFLVAMWRAPESPRFLIQHDRSDDGFRVLEHILGTEDARIRTDDIQASVRLEQEMSNEFTDLFRPGLGKALLIGIFLAVFNQAVGINAISYYGPVMFSRLGFGGDTEFLTSACVGGFELVFTVIGMYLIDTVGRKQLMAVGAGLMTVFAMCIAVSYIVGMPLLTLVFIMLFAASFAFSMGPIPWVVIPELFPTFLRGRATGLCVMCLLTVNWAVAQFTPMMVDNLGGGITFLVFGLLDIVCLFGIVTLVPETMGRTLEEIEHLWQPRTPLAAAKYALSSADANIRHAEAAIVRAENERQQALGILEAAERARVTAQKQIFDIQAKERAQAERLSAERAVEEARKAAHTLMSVPLPPSDAASGAASAARHPTADDLTARVTHDFGTDDADDDTLMSTTVPIAPSGTRPEAIAATERAHRIAADLMAGTATAAELGDGEVRRITVESNPMNGADIARDITVDLPERRPERDLDADATAAVDAIDMLDVADKGRTVAEDDSRHTDIDPTVLDDAELPDMDATRRLDPRRIPPTASAPDPLLAARDHAEAMARQRAEDAREAKAIDDALDTLDSFIKG